MLIQKLLDAKLVPFVPRRVHQKIPRMPLLRQMWTLRSNKCSQSRKKRKSQFSKTLRLKKATEQRFMNVLQGSFTQVIQRKAIASATDQDRHTAGTN